MLRADLVTGVTLDEVDDAMALWAPFRLAHEEETGRRTQHSHWDWSRKARAVDGAPNYTIVGVRVGVQLQGLMLWDDLHEKGQLGSQLGLDLVYIHFISTAPWNDRSFVLRPDYLGVGTLLVVAAVKWSIHLGFEGRLGLHSLLQAELFYRDRCKMKDLGPDTSGGHNGLHYFEFTPSMARDFLNRSEGKR